jgi:hypothetical protein
MESWVGTKNIPFCSGYHVLTVLQIYKRKRSLTCSEQNVTYYGPWVIFSELWPDNPIPWWNPLSATAPHRHTGHLYGLSQYPVKKLEDSKRVCPRSEYACDICHLTLNNAQSIIIPLVCFCSDIWTDGNWLSKHLYRTILNTAYYLDNSAILFYLCKNIIVHQQLHSLCCICVCV